MELLHQVGNVLRSALGWVVGSSWLPPKDFEVLRWLIVPGFGYGIVLVAFGIAEALAPQVKRPWGRATRLSATYLLFAGKMGVYALILTPAMRKGWLALGLPSLHLDRVLPLPLYMLVGVLCATFIGYWCHRLMHRVPTLWQIHKIHHSVENLNFSSVYHKHLLETLLQTPAFNLMVLALGTDLVAPFGIIFKLVDVLGHANVKLDLGRLAYLFSTPQAHRIHHSKDPRHYNSNFGTTFMFWDLLFGTFRYDAEHPATAFGVDEPVPQSFVQQQVLPFVWMARTTRAWWVRFATRVRGLGGRVATGD